MPYIEKTVALLGGALIIKHKTFSLRFGRKAARGVNICKTSEKQAEINRRRSDDNRIYKIIENFLPCQSYWITLTYRLELRPGSIDEAHSIFTKFIAKLRRIGGRFAYMGKTEMPESGAVHHHLLADAALCTDLLIKHWSFGSVKDIKLVYKTDDLKLANYFVKNEGTHSCIECKYTQSRGLKTPEIKTRIVSASSWRKEPRAKKGYKVVDVQNYFDILGFEAQKYIMLKEDHYGCYGKDERGGVSRSAGGDHARAKPENGQRRRRKAADREP